ncbi:hypothetical protein [uncultured Williamsia sp.]|uniref:hypothetical protein n=1 Tax=uncultured Williamsia sp. TaxID=259311 RepID=UPI002620D837|nr:hypothetical protein [uncultured Williamsia sp.]
MTIAINDTFWQWVWWITTTVMIIGISAGAIVVGARSLPPNATARVVETDDNEKG